jgi:GNAT superfamily N-acetyltransferase
VSRPSVRRATAADAEAIAGVHVRAWREGYRGIVAEELTAARSIEYRVEQWRPYLSSDANARMTLVAEVAGEIAGVACFEMPPERESFEAAEVRIFYVDPAHWRSGVGRALMAATLDALREEGRADAVLWVMTANERARRFYEALGWEADGGAGEWAGVSTVRYRRSLA